MVNLFNYTVKQDGPTVRLSEETRHHLFWYYASVKGPGVVKPGQPAPAHQRHLYPYGTPHRHLKVLGCRLLPAQSTVTKQPASAMIRAEIMPGHFHYGEVTELFAHEQPGYSKEEFAVVRWMKPSHQSVPQIEKYWHRFQYV